MKHIYHIFLKIVCNLFTSDKCSIHNPKNILISARFKIGDSIMLTPLLKELKIAFPDVKIDILTGSANDFMFQNNPNVNETFKLYKSKMFYKNFINIFCLRKKNYSVVIDLLPLKIGNFLYLKLLNSSLFIGDNLDNRYNIDVVKNNCFDLVLPRSKQKLHMSEQFSRFLIPFNIHPKKITTEVYYGEDELQKAINFLEKFKLQKNILINIDGSAKERCFYIDDYKYLTSKLCLLYPDYNIFISSLSPRHDEIKSFVKAENITNLHQLYDTKTIFEITAFISRVNLLISPDTSLVHIASALNINCVAVYSGNKSIFSQWHPNSKLAKVVTPPITNQNSIINFQREDIIMCTKELLNANKK